MTPDEIQVAAEQGLVDTFEGVDPRSASLEDDCLSVGAMVVVTVRDISTSVDQNADVEVFDASGHSIATLCFTRQLGRVDRSQLTKWQFVAFLADSSLDDAAEAFYVFKDNYIVLEADKYAEYRDQYRVSAPLWGGFSHSLPPSPEVPTERASISVIPGIHFPTVHHEEAFRRYVRASSSLDRFLRLYHTLELLFDFVVFARIKALGDNLLGFSQLLSEHGRSELDRLKAIIREFCSNPVALAEAFKASTAHASLREEIFHSRGKDGDPIKDQRRWLKVIGCIDAGQVSFADWSAARIVGDQDEYNRLIADVCAYWIYRVRSSIAHSRVGEYLLQDQDATFVRDFAEPMLLEVTTQVFSNEVLRSIS